MDDRLVTVFGGSGFIGRYVVKHLAARGARVRVAVRRPDEALFLKPMGAVGQIVTCQANIRVATSVAAAVSGADAVVNLVGIAHERKPQTFAAVHAQGAGTIARAAAAAGVSRLVQISAIGADAASPALYAASKAAGEAAVGQAFPGATILRPGFVFGPEDRLFNRFAALARLAPALPLIGSGAALVQPVYAGDVAAAVVRVLEQPETAGKIFELGGPEVLTFADLLRLALREAGRRRMLVALPRWVAMLAAFLGELALPEPPLTRDFVLLLERDTVANPALPGLADLGITPTAIEAIVPAYLQRYRRGGAKVQPRLG